MKTVITAALLAILAATAAEPAKSNPHTDIEQTNISVALEALPLPVQQTLLFEAGDALLAESEYNTESELYLFRTTGRGTSQLFLIIAPDGDLRVRSREIGEESDGLPLDPLPLEARTYVLAALTSLDGRVVEVTEDLHGGAVIGYEAEIAFANNSVRWFSFAPDGSLRDERDAETWNVEGR